MALIVTSLFLMHKRQRARRQLEIREYYEEQTMCVYYPLYSAIRIVFTPPFRLRNSIIGLHTAARRRHPPILRAKPNMMPVIHVQPPTDGGSVFSPTTD
jgi:hypothetical protein